MKDLVDNTSMVNIAVLSRDSLAIPASNPLSWRCYPWHPEAACKTKEKSTMPLIWSPSKSCWLAVRVWTGQSVKNETFQLRRSRWNTYIRT